jgi:hypothetical protein
MTSGREKRHEGADIEGLRPVHGRAGDSGDAEQPGARAHRSRPGRGSQGRRCWLRQPTEPCRPRPPTGTRTSRRSGSTNSARCKSSPPSSTRPVSRDLTTLANVKAELGLTDTTNDVLLKRYITAASSAAAQYCNRVFQVESLQDQFLYDGRSNLFRQGPEILQLSRWPIAELTSVVENNGVTLVEDTDFLTDVRRGQLTRIDSSGRKCHWSQCRSRFPTTRALTRFPRRRGCGDPHDHRAVFQQGPRPHGPPGEPSQACCERHLLDSDRIEAGNMSPDVADILDNYRVPVVA